MPVSHITPCRSTRLYATHGMTAAMMAPAPLEG